VGESEPVFMILTGGAMLSLSELRRAARIIREVLSGAALRRVAQQDEYGVVLALEAPAGKVQLLLSSRPEFARICLGAAPEQNPPLSSFCQYAKAHLTGSSLSDVDVPEDNRQIALRFHGRDSLFVVMLSIMGARSNIYLIDSDGKLVHSVRPLDATRPELGIGDVWADPRGAAPSESVDRWGDVPDSRYLASITETYQRLESEYDAQMLALKIKNAIKKERAFLDRKYVNLQEDLGEARQAESYRRKGELLKSVLHAIKPGADKIVTTDYQTGETVEIPLDPKLSPAANLESCFARYHKQTRGVKMIQQQLEELESARSELSVIEQRLDDAPGSSATDPAVLKEMISQPVVRRLISRYSPRRKPETAHVRRAEKKEIPTRLQPKRYRTQDGLEIWVGRNDEGNDYLTTRLARGNDLFFHLDGYPGSHVVLRTEGRTDPSPKSVLDACELAVHFSKMKNAGSADVHVAPIKNVKKPKGAKPGLVYVRSGKTIRLKRDPKRLQSILASRTEE